MQTISHTFPINLEDDIVVKLLHDLVIKFHLYFMMIWLGFVVKTEVLTNKKNNTTITNILIWKWYVCCCCRRHTKWEVVQMYQINYAHILIIIIIMLEYINSNPNICLNMRLNVNCEERYMKRNLKNKVSK